MPRIAIGDLSVDVEVPERFRCDFSTSGSLLAESEATDESFELSAITVQGGSAVDIVRARAAESGATLLENRDDFVSCFSAPAEWLAGTAEHVLVATVNAGPLADFAQLLSSVAPAHDPFGDGAPLAIVDLRPSHDTYFAHHRSAALTTAEQLDAYWTALVSRPPADDDALEDSLRTAAVAFGDLLCARGFTWAFGRDGFGTSLGVVALRGMADVWVVPDDFIGKRWERRELHFVSEALASSSARLEKMRSDWKRSLS
ncbi:MAG: hypothetical protein DI536_18065 [Archangium gephyra]|uniref:Uncharacterized protein n=1 Tax=Archangium gephyra TaxID=48 RepID=A0A2W5TAV3_9BACT|nr:MAG: hypothetical protein DI536_18065 [Archangium gephyra]